MKTVMNFFSFMALVVLFLLSGAFRVTAATSVAATYYLDNTHGSDANDGLTSATAWATLGRVNQFIFRPGDRLLIRAGTRYAGQLLPQGSGSMDAGGTIRMVVIDRYGTGDPPAIDGGGATRDALELRNVEYIGVNNLEITNRGPAPQARRLGVRLGLSNFGTAHHVYLRNLFIHDVNGSEVKADGGGAGIEIAASGSTVPSRFDGLLIENCHLLRCDRNGITGGGSASRQNWLPSLHVVIRGNLLEDIGGDGIVLKGSDGALVEHNVLSGCGSRLPAGDAAAGIWPWSADNTIIQFNEVHHQSGPIDAQGYDADWNCSGTVIQYNYSHDNEGGFLLVCNKGGAPDPGNVGNVGAIIRYNLSVNDGWRSTGKLAGQSPTFQIAGPCKGTRIYNNTIIIGKKSSGIVDRRLVFLSNWGGWASDTVFRNNIFYSKEWMDFSYGQSKGNVFDHNLYYGDLRHSPTDSHPLKGDPRFVNSSNPAGSDGIWRTADDGLALQSDSPCINAGVADGLSITDILGHPRSGLPDTGAYEYTARSK